MPNILNLKKQAKLVLRWRRDRYYPVAAQIRTLPRFRHLGDREVLAADFKLRECTGAGCKTVRVRKLAGAQDKESIPCHISPVRRTRSLSLSPRQPSCLSPTSGRHAIFTQKLGFLIVVVYGEPPFYAQVRRDKGLLNLKCVDYPVIDPQLRDRESLLSADMTVDTSEEIKRLFLEFQVAGVVFFQTLRTEPWGARTFIVKDPDGNLLLFAGSAD
jgi:hypothetical protein